MTIAISTRMTTIFMFGKLRSHGIGAGQEGHGTMAIRESIDGTPEPGQASARRRFRPGLVPTLATVVGVALFVSAGQWQFHRMQAKEALRARYEAAIAMPPSTLPALPASDDWATERYRRVIAQGQYDASHQFLLDNKVHAGRAGYDVVTPL